MTPEKLRMIEAAEYVLRDLGFRDVRVRHHELEKQNLARIELASAEIPALLANGKLAVVADELKKIGYAHVTLDLQGYRRGGSNQSFDSPKVPAAKPMMSADRNCSIEKLL